MFWLDNILKMVDGDKFLTIFNMKMTHVKYLVVLSCHSFANIYKKKKQNH